MTSVSGLGFSAFPETGEERSGTSGAADGTAGKEVGASCVDDAPAPTMAP
jgi:hypothetical protein